MQFGMSKLPTRGLLVGMPVFLFILLSLDAACLLLCSQYILNMSGNHEATTLDSISEVCRDL